MPRHTPALSLAFALLMSACAGCAARGSAPNAAAAESDHGDRWEAQEGFAVRFPPGFPAPTRAVRQTEDGEGVAYTSGLDGNACMIIVGPAPTEGAPNEQLDGMRDAIHVNGDVVETFSALVQAGRPARLLTFHGQAKSGATYHSRGLLVHGGSKIFFVTFSSKDPAARSAPEVDAYLASFELTTREN
jgi:hypothetical protein